MSSLRKCWLLDGVVQVCDQRVDVLTTTRPGRLLDGVRPTATEVHFVVAEHRHRLWPAVRDFTDNHVFGDRLRRGFRMRFAVAATTTAFTMGRELLLDRLNETHVTFSFGFLRSEA